MSCTENESGLFVVFFLPAVVGCLTILLARRWTNSHATSTSSTAVSRRRKIIKDPLVKRPLPTIACKMVIPSCKKTTGVAKKGSFSLPEEEVGKRVGRPARLSSTAPVPEKPDGPVVPKHIPFPYIPQDGELLFESMSFVFTLVATGLQFLNLYRTAWWLPHSNTNEAMHFHLIDPHLVAFIVTVLLRRVLLCVTLAVLELVLAPRLIPQATVAARMFILGVVLGALAWCAYFLVSKYPLDKIFYLCYPAAIYFLLFGLQAGPFLELNRAPAPLHCCARDPPLVRAEVDLLIQDFNQRLNKILFNSVLGAYYSSFIPCCFAQSYLYYDVYGAAQQVAFVWGLLFGRYANQLLSAAHCDVSHRAALHLGRWSHDNTCIDTGEEVCLWSGTRLWARGARVAARGAVLHATTASVAAAPADKHHQRFHVIFIDPSMLLCALLCLQLSLVVLQLCLLFSSMPWHNYISIVILLFINYYTLFKMLRDYLVAWKVYKAEFMIQDKNNSAPVN